MPGALKLSILARAMSQSKNQASTPPDNNNKDIKSVKPEEILVKEILVKGGKIIVSEQPPPQGSTVQGVSILKQ